MEDCYSGRMVKKGLCEVEQRNELEEKVYAEIENITKAHTSPLYWDQTDPQERPEEQTTLM